MRYFFEGRIQVDEEGGLIQIPFNVWEVCKYREVIKADIIFDNKQINCDLLPADNKGYYNISLTDKDLKDVDLSHPHKILMHVSGSLIKIDQNSPYDFRNPIRKIDNIELICQEDDGLCGQTVVAMLANKTIAEIISVMDCREWQGTMGRMISALNYYGIDHSDVICFTQGNTEVVFPKCCILMEKMARFSHYLLYFNGTFYDPNLGILEEYDVSKLNGYLEIKVG